MASFDLIVATVDRTDELGRLLRSFEAQTHRDFRVLVVDQNEDERVVPLLRGRSFTIERIRAPRGLSRARNAALDAVEGDVVAFPDDDCVYPPDLLERVDRRFDSPDGLDGLTGRGGSSPPWKTDAAVLTRDNLWNRVISYTLFLRANVLARVGAFDEELGLGSGRPWSSAEEIDYVIRALEGGSRIEYDPDLVVEHTPAAREQRTLAERDGASIGYLLRKHGYPAGTLARMLVRPIGGAAVALARRDAEGARFHVATLRGRVSGYRHAAV